MCSLKEVNLSVKLSFTIKTSCQCINPDYTQLSHISSYEFNYFKLHWRSLCDEGLLIRYRQIKGAALYWHLYWNVTALYQLTVIYYIDSAESIDRWRWWSVAYLVFYVDMLSWKLGFMWIGTGHLIALTNCSR